MRPNRPPSPKYSLRPYRLRQTPRARVRGVSVVLMDHIPGTCEPATRRTRFRSAGLARPISRRDSRPPALGCRRAGGIAKGCKNGAHATGLLLGDFDPVVVLDPQIHSLRQLRCIQAAEPALGDQQLARVRSVSLRLPAEVFDNRVCKVLQSQQFRRKTVTTVPQEWRLNEISC